MFFELFPLMLALCGSPKLKQCYIESINCNHQNREMVCSVGVVIKEKGKKTIRKNLKVKK